MNRIIKKGSWQVFLRTAMELKRPSGSMRGFDVAGLGARLLKDPSNLRNGSFEAPK